MIPHTNEETTRRYFPTESEITILTWHMKSFFSLPERDPARSRIVQACSTQLSFHNPQWSTQHVRFYFNNHKKDILQFVSEDNNKKPKKLTLDQQNILESSINSSVLEELNALQVASQTIPGPLVNSLFLTARVSNRFSFLRIANLDGDISTIFSSQNFNNQLPQNASETVTYLDELLTTFNFQETNLLEQFPSKLESLNNEQIVLIVNHLANEDLSQRQILRYFSVNYYALKKFLKNHGFPSINLIIGRLESYIPDDLEQLVMKYRQKFTKGYQSIFKTLRLKGLSISEKQIRSIFKKNNLWMFRKDKQDKKIHNKRYVALYCNMEWLIDLHCWNTVNNNSEVVVQYLFAVIDDLTRYLLFTKVLNNKTMESTALALRECIEITNCKPYIIATDNGKEFTGHDFEQVLRDNQIKHYYTHPYTPEENAKLERWWGTLEGSIINQEDLDTLVKEYNFNWVHKELERMIAQKIAPADAWKSFKRYEGVPEENLIVLLW
jgi:transposase InsO family protein